MKVSFLCPTIEPGRDGVGDYVIQFVRALLRRGHQCQVVALADRHAPAPFAGRLDGTDCELVRIPARAWERGEIEAARRALDRFAPDWRSLQMVCYGYDRRGFLLGSRERLLALRGAGKRHIMFHELWVGAGQSSTFKERATGWLQRRLLSRVIADWAPNVMHTSNPAYRALLASHGFKAGELPLPGGIPILCEPQLTQRIDLLRDRFMVAPHSTPARLIAGVFGSIHESWADKPWLQALLAACRASGRDLALVQIGRPGALGRRIWDELRARHGVGVEFLELGELDAEDVSAAMRLLDLGIATTPWALVGKSSSVAAMLEHGLPVVVPREDFRLRSIPTPEPTPHPLLYRLDQDFLRRVRGGGPLRGQVRAREEMYNRLLDALAATGLHAPEREPGPAHLDKLPRGAA